MLKDFEAVKAQLKELAEVVNTFKSEAVQLRIVELVLGGAPDQVQEGTSRGRPPSSPARARRPAKPKPSDETTVAPANRGRAGRLGGKAVLKRLYDEQFFQTGRTINDIVDHADAKLATKLKQSDLSGGLARYVRDGKLDRTKNAENQYEYVVPKSKA
jgi:hypothetical protein